MTRIRPRQVGTRSNPPSGNCAFSEGQFLFNWYGEQIYAHYANGILYAAYQNPGEGFKPQSWMQGTGFDPSKASCFAVNNPLTSTPIPPVTNPPTTNPPSGNCAYSEGQFLLNWYGEQIYAHYFNGTLYAAYQDGNVGFKPRSWLSGLGYDASKLACFAQNDPHTTTTSNPTTNPTNNPQNPPSTAGNNLNGSFDFADCNSIGGWIFNANTPNQSTKFDVYVNGWLAAAGVPATRSRQDVANALGVSGYNAFGFNIKLPNQYKAGVVLTISVKYAGTNTHIPGSPKITQTCPSSPSTQGGKDPCDDYGIASVFPRSEQARSSATAHTGSVSLQLVGKGSANITSLTSRLIPVQQGGLSLDAYAFAPVRLKPSLTPQLTTAIVGGVLAGLVLTQQKTTMVDQRRTSQLMPALGISSALMLPLVKSLLANRLPKASLELAFYNEQGKFVHRQQVRITKVAREGWQLLHLDGYAPEDGYAVIRLRNRSEEPVYFDDLSFKNTSTPVIKKSEEKHLLMGMLYSANGFDIGRENDRQSASTISLFEPCKSYGGGAIIDPGSSWPGVWLDIDVTVTATPTGAEPTGSTGGGTTYTQSGSSTFTPQGTPSRPPVGTIYTSSSGVIYIWDGTSWCIILKEVDVKGNPPSNPPDGYVHLYVDPNFGYITVYKFFDGHWILPVITDNESFLPDRIKNAKKSSKNDACKTFKAMWDRQNNDTHKEQVAIITDKGVFWLPDDGNTVNTGIVGETYDFIGTPGNQSFVLNNVVYYIKSTIHTHPTGDQWGDGPSDKDVALAKRFNIPGYNISDGGIFKVSASGQISGVLDYNYENIFNCELDQNIVEELR